MKIIGLAGQLMSGKDTFADRLCQILNENGDKWVRNAFANNVKKIFMDTFQVDWNFIEKWKRTDEIPEGFNKPIRECLTFIGSGFRKIKSNIWIDLAFRNLDDSSNQIISDVRYINEAVRIRELNGLTILLWRKGFENNIQNDSEQELVPFVKQLLDHEIEGLIDPSLNIPFDIFIKNDSSLDAFHEKMDKIVIPYIERKYAA